MARTGHRFGLTHLCACACLSACSAVDVAPADRIVAVAEPLAPASADAPAHERFLGTIRLPLATIDDRSIGPTPIRPVRAHDSEPGSGVVVEFRTTGLQGASGRLGLLPPRGAARQEVAHDMPGQPDDRRAEWIELELVHDGAQRFVLPPPGPDWHADWAVVALELRRGRTVMPALAGPSSEMLSDGTRVAGGRIILGVVPVERRPTRVGAVAVGEAIEVDGRLDEAAWDRPGIELGHSRTGEPATEIDALLGGSTEVWFAWDRQFLYVAGSLPDRDIYTPHAGRDDPLYRDEAFEVFVAADGSGNGYLEHQIAADGVVFDARFPRYRKGDESWDGSWRGGVAIDGELDDRGDDRGWTVELAFAWDELCTNTEITCPPEPGMQLRVNVFRLDKPDRKRQVALALSPTLEPDFHAWANAAELVLLADGGAS